LSIFGETENINPVIEEIKKLDILNLTPIDALNLLYKLHLKIREE